MLFKESSTGFAFLTYSTIPSQETAKWEDGKEYPVFYMDISSASHPHYTGEQKILKTGAVDKFYARQKKMEELKKTQK